MTTENLKFEISAMGNMVLDFPEKINGTKNTTCTKTLFIFVPIFFFFRNSSKYDRQVSKYLIKENLSNTISVYW